ncbi:MAG: hypothetical protein ABIJ41_03270 [Candidatus Omnitrophota bacterium]
MLRNIFFKHTILAFFFMLSVFVFSHVTYANIYINLVAVNASPDETKTEPIKYPLPKEITPDNVVNSGGLELDYDLDKSQYFLFGTVELQPKESKTIKIEVKDVWRITQEEVDILRTQIEENVSQLQGTDYQASAGILGQNMIDKLDRILASQVNYSDNIERRIEEYRANVDSIEKIRKNAFSADYFKSEQRPATETTQTVRFVIEIENPYDEKKTFTQRHFLPQEVRAEHIIELQGFDMRFSQEKQQSYLTKSEELGPHEKKKYTIEIKDIWQISQEKIDAFLMHTEDIVKQMEGSEYEGGASFISDRILNLLDLIQQTQQNRQNMSRYIGAFRTNQERFKDVQEEIDKLELLLARVKAKKLEKLENSKVTNILQKLQALRGIAAISEAIFGKKPTMTTTWRIIYGILIFIVFFTSIHFFTWWKKSQIMGEELAVKAGGTIKKVKAAENPEEEKT